MYTKRGGSSELPPLLVITYTCFILVTNNVLDVERELTYTLGSVSCIRLLAVVDLDLF